MRPISLGMRDVHLAQDLREAGYSYDEIRRNPALTHLRRGSWFSGPLPDDRRERFIALVRGTYAQLPAGGALSHVAAAVLHGLPAPHGELHHVTVTRAGRHRGFQSRYVKVVTNPLSADDVVAIGTLPVTSLARTVADVSRTWQLPWAVAVADAALRQGLQPEHLREIVERGSGLAGTCQARRVIDLMNALAESPGESISRVFIAEAGLPAPTLQKAFPYDGGRDIPDLSWSQCGGVIGEFDGFGKYLKAPIDEAADPAQVVYLEKRREDRLRSHVRRFLRWGWDDLYVPERFLVPLGLALDCRVRRPLSRI